jgi:hypothetical protein
MIKYIQETTQLVDITESSSRGAQPGALSPFQNKFPAGVKQSAEVLYPAGVKNPEVTEYPAGVKGMAGEGESGESSERSVCPYPPKERLAKNIKSEIKNGQICTESEKRDQCVEGHNEKESSTVADTNTFASSNTVSEVSLLLTMRTPLTPIHTGSH